MKPLRSVLIKPAGPDCSLACEYCFYLEKSAIFASGPHRMSEAVLRTTVRQVMQQGGREVSFGWQGGEPTLMGLPFFELAVQYQARCGRPGQVVGNGLQTNGLHLDSRWARFLAESQFLVGLSLDGPEHVHDRYRRFRGGEGSWKRVAASRDLLLNAGVAVNALIVVNDYSARFPEEIYRFHTQSGISHLQFIPCLENDPAGGPAAYSVSPEAYGRFLIALFDLWWGDFRRGVPSVSIRWFESLLYTYLGLPAPECTLLPECGIYLVVEHNGDLYSCDFYVDGEHRLGHISDGRLLDLLNSGEQAQFGAVKRAWPSECASCPWLSHCHGGCPRDRRFTPSGVSYFCASWKAFFAHADAPLRALAAQIARKTGPPRGAGNPAVPPGT